MKNSLLVLIAACLLPGAVHASSFAATMDRLGVQDPEFIFHVNLENDFQTAAAFLTDAYLAYLMTSPDIPPVPVDFNRLFGHLGLLPATSFSVVSEARQGGGFSNQMLFRFSEAPSGLFLLGGDRNEPFSILQAAPVDADLVAEMSLNGVGLFNIVRSVVIDIMGPMGQGLIDGQMNQPVVPDGPTLADIINRLTTRVQVAIKPAEEADIQAALLNGQSAVRVGNIADLLQSFAPFLEQAGFAPMDDPHGLAWTMAVPGTQVPVTVLLQPVPETNDILVSLNESSRAWFLGGGAPVSANPEFRKAAAGLPQSGLSFWYSSERFSAMQIQSLDAQMGADPQFAPLIQTLQAMLQRYVGPQAGVALLEDDAYRVINFQPGSYKTNIALAGAIIPASFLSTMAPHLSGMMEEDDDDDDDDDDGY
jgi:hypothetical protein